MEGETFSTFFNDLKNEIELYVQNKLDENWDRTAKRDEKLIRDCVHGSLFLEPYAVHILDSPLLQRLRQIYQNGMTFFVYPTSIQTRFDHTLGVTILAEKFIDFLKRKSEMSYLIEEKDKINLKLASLLHDVGHGLFSHISENIYEEINYFKEAKKEFQRNIRKKFKSHEFISYLIVQSKIFQDFLDELSKIYDFEYDVNDISEFIIGTAETHPEKKFLAEILNGSLDVDKLDYMKRDSYFLGFNLPVEIEQIMYRTKIKTDPINRLVIDIRGIHNIDQLIFNRTYFYSSVYLHHKVRAATCMIKAIFEIIKNNDLEIYGKNFSKVTDFLSIGDQQLLSFESTDAELKEYIENIRNRKLYKRILEICPANIEQFNYNKDAWDLFEEKLHENPENFKEELLSHLISVGITLKKHEIWVDLPDEPKYKDLLPDIQISEDKIIAYLDIFDAKDFFDNYFTGRTEDRKIKLKTYIFGRPENDLRKILAEKIRDYIKSEFKLELKDSAISKIVE